MIQSVIIEPRVGALPIKFGMKKRAVDKLLGKPSFMTDSSALPGQKEASYNNINIAYDSGSCVTSIVLTPGIPALFHGVDLFSMSNPAAYVFEFDSDSLVGSSFITFRTLLISICGVVDPVEDQLSIHVNSRWELEEFLSLYKPWRPEQG